MKKRPHILIIDDDPLILDLAQDALARDYDLFTARDSLESVEFLLTTTLDLLIVDVGLPVVNGVELIRIIRAHAPFPDIPIIVLPASPESRLPLGALRVEAVLRKPFSIAELARTVAETLDRSNRSRRVIPALAAQVWQSA